MLGETSQSASGTSAEIDYAELFGLVRAGKWLIVAFTVTSTALGVTYALLAEEWFRAEALLIPAESEDTAQILSGSLGSIASLAGVNLNRSGDEEEALAVLESRSFTRAFIHDQNLLPILFPNKQTSKEQDSVQLALVDDEPDIRDAVIYFDEVIRQVQRDRDTGLVTLSIQWKDPEAAAQWANTLIRRLNERMRQQALASASRNLTYLRGELEQTSVVPLQQSIGRLLEAELQKLMLARGYEEFAFRVIDYAEPPKYKYKPVRSLIVLLALMGGAVAGTAFVIVRAYLQRRRHGTA